MLHRFFLNRFSVLKTGFWFSKLVSNRFSVFETICKTGNLNGFETGLSFQNCVYKVFNCFKDFLDRIFESFINLPLQTSQKYFWVHLNNTLLFQVIYTYLCLSKSINKNIIWFYSYWNCPFNSNKNEKKYPKYFYTSKKVNVNR